MERLLEILKSIVPDTDVETAADLVDGGHLTSLKIIQLVSALCDEFDIEITARELVPENFNDAASMWRMIEELQDE